MGKTKLAWSLSIALVAVALAAAPAAAKSRSGSTGHSSSSHSTSHTTAPPKPAKGSTDHTGQTVFPKGKSPVVHACKTNSCRSKHPTGFYYNAR